MTETTSDRIVDSALELILSQGIRKTSMDDVAAHAGVTRVTIYRYFRDKRELVAAAFMYVAGGIEDVNRRCATAPPGDIGAYLRALGDFFATLPKGNFAERQQELQRVYPDVWEEFRRRRRTAIHHVFSLMLEVADAQGIVRDDLHRRVVEAYFQAAVINIMEHPSLVSLNLSASEVYATASSIFMHGILKDSVEAGEDDDAREPLLAGC
jgi:AcrR family transcriptional regulator